MTKLSNLTKVTTVGDDALFYIVDPARSAGDRSVGMDKDDVKTLVGGSGSNTPVSKTGTTINFTEVSYWNKTNPLTNETIIIDITNAKENVEQLVYCNRYIAGITGDFKYKTETKQLTNALNVLKFTYDGVRVYLEVFNIIYLEESSGVQIEGVNTVNTISNFSVENAEIYSIYFNEVLNNYSDNASMFADQAGQILNKLYKVISTGLYYEYQGTTNGDLTDYIEVGVNERSNAVTLPSYNGRDTVFEHTSLTNDREYLYWFNASANGYFNNTQSLFSATPVASTGLNFDPAFSETISLTSTKVLSGEFEVIFNMLFTAEDAGYAPLFNSSTTNRLIISQTNSNILMSIEGANLSGSFSFSQGVEYKIRVYRDVSNNVFAEINDGTPISLGSTSNNLSISNIGRGSANSGFRLLTGNIRNFTLGNAFYSLTEGSGTALTASNGETATYNTTGDAAHLQNVSWGAASSGLANKVVNAGENGNNTVDLLNKVGDFTGKSYTSSIIMIGTNDSLNTAKYISASQFKINLTSLVTQLQSDGQEVILLTIPPAIDSYLKSRHDYTPIYGDESLFNVNDKIGIYNTKILEVSTEQSTGIVDINALFGTNGDPKETVDSWLQNIANSGSSDGIHPTASGADEIAIEVDAYLTANTIDTANIVCIGDSITVGNGLLGAGTITGDTYPAKLSDLLN